MQEFLITFSKAILSSKNASESPFLTPLVVIRGSDRSACILTWHRLFSVVAWTSVINLSGNWKYFIATYSLSLLILSYAMWDFKFSRRRVWCSELSSGLYCRVKCLSSFYTAVQPRRQLWTSLSYAVLKSIRKWWVSILYTAVFSRICLNVYISPVVDLPCRKPHW
jgi:hypothetical protein